MLLGAGRAHVDDVIDPGAGLLLAVRVGDRVEAGRPAVHHVRGNPRSCSTPARSGSAAPCTSPTQPSSHRRSSTSSRLRRAPDSSTGLGYTVASLSTLPAARKVSRMPEQRRIDPRWLILGAIAAVAIALNYQRFAVLDLARMLADSAALRDPVPRDHPARDLPRVRGVSARRSDGQARGPADAQPDRAHRPDRHRRHADRAAAPVGRARSSSDTPSRCPFNPRNFKDERTGMLLTGIAGPVTNIVLAIVFGLLIAGLPATGRLFWNPASIDSLGSFLLYFCYANLVLAFFNLVPIPPLDGSRVRAVDPAGQPARRLSLARALRVHHPHRAHVVRSGHLQRVPRDDGRAGLLLRSPACASGLSPLGAHAPAVSC